MHTFPQQSMLKLKTVVAASAVVFSLAACEGQAGLVPEKAAGMADAGLAVVKAASLTDDDVKTLSDKSCAALDAEAKIAPAKSREARRLAQILRRMPTSVNETPLNYKVYLTKDVNAWAMNNGCVRIYSGLMAMMNDNEVRGVLGHEIGHVALGHAKSAMQVAYAASAARQMAAASGNAMAAEISGSELGELAEKLVNAQFSQAQESAADDYSYDLLTTAKLRRDGLVSAFEKLAKLGDKSSMFSSHPPSAERAQHIRDRLAGKKQ